MRKNYGQKEFLAKCVKHHGEIYDYSKTIFTMGRNDIIIICSIHGEVKINANNHACGHGCPKCGNEATANKRRFTKEQIVKRATDIWGDRFDYSQMEYTGILDRHEIKCNLCGEYFSQDLNNHINYKKNGCPNCKENRGWSRSQWIDFCNKKFIDKAIVYFVRMFDENESFIKIGMPSMPLARRFDSKTPYKYELIKIIYGTPEFVYNKEIELHRKFAKSRYHTLKSFKGEFECFSIDILKDIIT